MSDDPPPPEHPTPGDYLARQIDLMAMEIDARLKELQSVDTTVETTVNTTATTMYDVLLLREGVIHDH